MTEHHLDPGSIGPRWAGTEPQEPDPRCVCGAAWSEDRCLDEPELDLLTEVSIGLLKRPLSEWHAYLGEQHTRAVAADRMDVCAMVVETLDRLGPAPYSPATPDGVHRSRCLAKAAGEAWIAPLGTPWPEHGPHGAAGQPMIWPGNVNPLGWVYAGAVGWAGKPPFTTFDNAEHADMLDPTQIYPRQHAPEGTFVWHDPHLAMLDLAVARQVIVVTPELRYDLPDVRHVDLNGMTPARVCATVETTSTLHSRSRAGDIFSGGAYCVAWAPLAPAGPNHPPTPPTEGTPPT